MGAGCWCYLRWQVFVYKAIVYMLEKNGPIMLTAVSKGHPPPPLSLTSRGVLGIWCYASLRPIDG